jgi:hypothetical protein
MIPSQVGGEKPSFGGRKPTFYLVFLAFFYQGRPLPMHRGHPPSFLSYRGESRMPCLPLWGSFLAVREVSMFFGAVGSRRIWVVCIETNITNVFSWSIDEIQSTMKKGNCGSFFLQRKALEALTNLLSLQ